MSYQITPLSFDQIKKNVEKGELYICNRSNVGVDKTTGKIVKRPMGAVHIQYREVNGDMNNVQIPPTWVPIELSMYCPLDLVANSNSFRQYIRTNMLIGIDSDEARRLLQNDDVRKELAKHADQIGTNINTLDSGSNSAVSVGPSLGKSSVSPEDKEVVNTQGDELQTIVDDYNKNEISDDEAVQKVDELDLSVSDITSAFESLQDTSSLLYERLMEIVENLETENSAGGAATFPAGT